MEDILARIGSSIRGLGNFIDDTDREGSIRDVHTLQTRSGINLRRAPLLIDDPDERRRDALLNLSDRICF